MLAYLVRVDVLILTEVNVEISCDVLNIPGCPSTALYRDKKGCCILVFVSDGWLSNRLNISIKCVEALIVKVHKEGIEF